MPRVNAPKRAQIREPVVVRINRPTPWIAGSHEELPASWSSAHPFRGLGSIQQEDGASVVRAIDVASLHGTIPLVETPLERPSETSSLPEWTILGAEARATRCSDLLGSRGFSAAEVPTTIFLPRREFNRCDKPSL
jgi:hypothetical protein